MGYFSECPFQCGWTVAEAHGFDDTRAALCTHLIVEHGASEERDPEGHRISPGDFVTPPFEFPSERKRREEQKRREGD